MRNPLQKPRAAGTLAQHLMNQPAVTCGQEDSLAHAARAMWEHDCGVVPVTDDEGRVIAMLTDRDICMAAYIQGSALHAMRVREAMSKQLIGCKAEDSLEEVERLMRQHQVRRLPVLDEQQRPLGVLSLGDIARYGVSASKRGRAEHEVTETLATICQPHHTSLQSGEASGTHPVPS